MYKKIFYTIQQQSLQFFSKFSTPQTLINLYQNQPECRIEYSQLFMGTFVLPVPNFCQIIDHLCL